jgi:hypothetical protein
MMPNGRTGPLLRIKPCVLVGCMFQLSPEGIAGCGCTSECSGPKVPTAQGCKARSNLYMSGRTDDYNLGCHLWRAACGIDQTNAKPSKLAGPSGDNLYLGPLLPGHDSAKLSDEYPFFAV